MIIHPADLMILIDVICKKLPIDVCSDAFFVFAFQVLGGFSL